MYNGIGIPSLEEGCPKDLFFLVNVITDYFDCTNFVSTQIGVKNIIDNTTFISSHCDMSQSYNFKLLRDNKRWMIIISPKNIPAIIKNITIDNCWDMKEIRSKLKKVFKQLEPKVSMCKKPWDHHTEKQFDDLLKRGK